MKTCELVSTISVLSARSCHVLLCLHIVHMNMLCMLACVDHLQLLTCLCMHACTYDICTYKAHYTVWLLGWLYFITGKTISITTRA